MLSNARALVPRAHAHVAASRRKWRGYCSYARTPSPSEATTIHRGAHHMLTLAPVTTRNRHIQRHRERAHKRQQAGKLNTPLNGRLAEWAPHSVQWITSCARYRSYTEVDSIYIPVGSLIISYFHRKASDLRTRNTTSFKATSLIARRPPRRKIPCWINNKVLEHTHTHARGT